MLATNIHKCAGDWQLKCQNIYKSRCCMWSSGLLSVFCLWRTESSICFGFASLSGSFPVEGQLEWLVKEVCGAKSCLLFIKALATCPPSSQTAENWKVTWGEALHEKIAANIEIDNWEISGNKEIGVSHVDEGPRSMNHMCPVLFRRSLYLFLPPRCRGDHYLDWNYSFIRF